MQSRYLVSGSLGETAIEKEQRHTGGIEGRPLEGTMGEWAKRIYKDKSKMSQESERSSRSAARGVDGCTLRGEEPRGAAVGRSLSRPSLERARLKEAQERPAWSCPPRPLINRVVAVVAV